ncbi:MAG: methyl-accepting chemotaxis protein [Ignavibacteriaceae bacterium]|nr:methyl-accepting chemotaxis protein [Ignavibacteriaceae bacterium]
MINWFDTMKVGKKISFGYGILLAILIIAAVVNSFTIRGLEDLMTETVKSTKVIDALDESKILYLDVEIELWNYIFSDNPETFKVYESTAAAYIESIQKAKSLESNYNLFAEKINEIDRMTQNKMSSMNKAVDFMRKGEKVKAQNILIEAGYRDYAHKIEYLMNEIKEGEFKFRNEIEIKRIESQDQVYWVSIGGSIIALIIGVFFSIVITKSVVNRVSNAINNIASTSTEIAATVNEHEKVASQQAASVNEITTTMNELDVTFSQTASKVSETANEANKATQTAETGLQTVFESSDSMTKLREKVNLIAEQILKLSEQTSQISSITSLVSDIAGQTNLLALNAAVEAARAGEQGKGFAVVAAEIRKLADQSKKSAEKINLLVNDIQKATNATVMVTEEGSKNVDFSIMLSNRAEVAFKELVEFINNTYDISQQTVFTVKQQVAAVKQVVESMNIINAGVKEAAAGISQTKVGVDNLNETAKNLKSIV